MMQPLQRAYDYVIVGAGSAGCVLAARLSEDPDVSVLILEAGPRDRGLMMQMPAGVYSVYHDRSINWNYESEPQQGLGGRRIPVPRGKTLGGSSSINALVYLRGHRQDYDDWAKKGLTDWSFAHCLPYFRKSETSDRGPSLYRGDTGPLHVQSGKLKSAIFDNFLDAASQAGHAISDDLNGAQPMGFGRMDSTTIGGRRCSAAVAYLHPAARRANLTVATGAIVRRIVIDNGRATGLLLQYGRDLTQIVARREVLLAAGAINSPQLLMLSGIGPADELKRHGIGVEADHPDVGANLQDHLNLGMSFSCTEPVSLAWIGSPLGKAAVGARWMINKDGPAASNIWEIGGFAKTDPSHDRPGVHYHLGPMMIVPNGKSFRLAHGFMLHMAQLRQKSRGRLALRSSEPTDAPAMDFRFLSEESDLHDMREGLKMTREIAEQPAIRRMGTTEVFPGKNVRSDADIEAMLRERLMTEFHPSCTCRMGTDDRAVVDAELRVRGVEALRVVDASVLPDIVGANLNATVYMIAEKAADVIRGREPLAPSALASLPGSPRPQGEFA
jgi:choline dehydrogenase